jgi:hypothetical protein
MALLGRFSPGFDRDRDTMPVLAAYGRALVTSGRPCSIPGKLIVNVPVFGMVRIRRTHP